MANEVEEYWQDLAKRLRDHAEAANPNSPDRLIHEALYVLVASKLGTVVPLKTD